MLSLSVDEGQVQLFGEPLCHLVAARPERGVRSKE